MTARARILALIDATRRLVRPCASDTLVSAMAAESGLSMEGVRHALDALLEVDRAERELDLLLTHPHLARADRPAVGVLLCAHVVTAPLRAIAWALALSPCVRIRASRRASTFVRALADAAPSLISLELPGDSPLDDLRRLVDALPSGSALHVYGGAGAIDAARSLVSARADLELEPHGPGFGVIVATPSELIACADAIALDVVAFDQRGCLSPRAAIVVGEGHRAASALHAALATLDVRIPRGRLSAEVRVEVALAIEAARFAGTAHVGGGHAVLELAESTSLAIGPAARVLPLLEVNDLESALARIEPFSWQITQIACSEAWRAQLGAIAPTCALGAMQTPPFDGPVDRRSAWKAGRLSQ